MLLSKQYQVGLVAFTISESMLAHLSLHFQCNTVHYNALQVGRKMTQYTGHLSPHVTCNALKQGEVTQYMYMKIRKLNIGMPSNSSSILKANVLSILKAFLGSATYTLPIAVSPSRIVPADRVVGMSAIESDFKPF